MATLVVERLADTIDRLQDGLRFGTLCGHAPDVHYGFDPGTRRLIFVSAEVEELLGYSHDELLHDPMLLGRLVCPSHRRLAWRMMRPSSDGASFEIHWRHRDGSIVCCEHRNVLIKADKGIAELWGTARDVTGRNRLEARLRQRQNDFQNVIGNARLGLWLLDPDGRITFVNRSLCARLGYSAQQIIGRAAFEFMNEPATGRVRLLLDTRLYGGSLRIDCRLVTRSGEELWSMLSTQPLRDASGGLIGVACLVVDLGSLQLRSGSITLDLPHLRVREHGRNVDLTLREIQLLRYLLKYRGRAVSRRQLLADVWGQTADLPNRTIDVHVCRLRKKLPSLAQRLRATGRGGYILANDREYEAAQPLIRRTGIEDRVPPLTARSKALPPSRMHVRASA